MPTRPCGIEFLANNFNQICPLNNIPDNRINEKSVDLEVHEKPIMGKQDDENLIDYYDRLRAENYELQKVILPEVTKPVTVKKMFGEVPEEKIPEGVLNFVTSLESMENLMKQVTRYLEGDEKIQSGITFSHLHGKVMHLTQIVYPQCNQESFQYERI